ncbi:MAG: sarcosine oxidase subunit gamma [Rhodobacterales bacterium]|nr:sarcosine oxidase subunit gamma [Rhodobacterales bacterium]
MADGVSVLGGVSVGGAVALRDLGLTGMVTVRGNLAGGALQAVCAGLAGVGFPGAGMATGTAAQGIAWMSPDEVMVFVAHDAAGAAVAQIDAALAGVHHLAVDVSDARALIGLSGAGARDVLAKLTPADMHPDAFRPGMFRRTRLGQVAAGIWALEDGSFAVMCFRSVADHVFATLAQSVKDGAVGHFKG